MVRAPEAAQPPEAQVMAERNRRKKLAFSKKMLSDSASKAQTQLGPSKTVLKHHGKDIIKKSQRKNRYLFSFPGLLAPLAGGKIGELKDLGTKNPILYLDFPQGQMKLFGTIVYPKNRYLTLHFSRGGKNVMCEDYFDCMIVFSDAWWIGRKEDNPEEVRLDFPTEMTQEQHVEHDFQGGAGGISVDKPVVNRSGRKRLKEDSPEIELQDDESDGENKSKATMEVTPVRHLVRNAGKRFRYTEASPEDDSNGGDVAQDAEEAEDGNSLLLDEFNAVESADRVDRSQQHTVAKSKKLLVTSVTQSMETAQSSQSSLVQSTIATLFKKAGEKKAPKDLKKSPRTKGGKSMTKKQGPEVEDEDEIEEMSSSSEDTDGSREEWTA